ncbi:MAG: ribbon-helix-helix protein, CopG family [Kiloniellales bacterium]|nr:ribbon-helix-helix protein, CopG family [Kiloniellales bacterium]
MATLTIRLPKDQHERLKALAARRGTSLNKLFEEFSTRALAEADVEARFLVRAARGDAQAGLALLDKLDTHFQES